MSIREPGSRDGARPLPLAGDLGRTLSEATLAGRDYATLEVGRRVIRVHLGRRPAAAIRQLAATLVTAAVVK